jgi:tetratricopeptide (TPR) repeat protein
MLNDDDAIIQQQELLLTYRRTLAHLLRQAAQYGGVLYVPPHVAHGIDEARSNIRSIKATLRANSVSISDSPDDEPSLQDIVTSRDRESTVSPFQVPYPPNSLFVGREADLAHLAALLDNSGSVAILPAITGIGGIGKTQLAIEFAHCYRDRFPGGIFWLDMEPAKGVASQIAACAGPGGLNLPNYTSISFDERIAAVRAVWHQPDVRLLVFDNLEDASLLRPWRPTSGGCRVLITTRRSTWMAMSGVQTIPIDTLARHDSLRLLLTPRTRHGIPALEVLLADPLEATVADAICNELGDLPLALALAGAYLETYPSVSLTEYHIDLKSALLEHPSLDTIFEEGLPTGHIASVAATFALSYQRLDINISHDVLARNTLHRLAWFAPTVVPRRLAMRVAQLDPDNPGAKIQMDRTLRRLSELGLIDLFPDSAIRMHRLVAAFVRKRSSDPQKDCTEAEFALITEVQEAKKETSPRKALSYIGHLRHTASQAASRFDAQSALLTSTLASLIADQGNLIEAKEYYQRALGIYERVFGQNHLNTTIARNNLASVLHSLGDLETARIYYEQAASHYSDLALSNLASLLWSEGDLEGAQQLYEQVLTRREHILGPSHLQTANSLHNLGVVLQSQGDLAGAKVYHERALRIRELLLGANHPDVATTLLNLGHLLHSEGHLEGAHLRYERALQIRERALEPDHPDIAFSLNSLGVVLYFQGKLVEAQQCYERALEIYEQRYGLNASETCDVWKHLVLLDIPINNVFQKTAPVIQQIEAAMKTPDPHVDLFEYSIWQISMIAEQATEAVEMALSAASARERAGLAIQLRIWADWAESGSEGGSLYVDLADQLRTLALRLRPGV